MSTVGGVDPDRGRGCSASLHHSAYIKVLLMGVPYGGDIIILICVIDIVLWP